MTKQTCQCGQETAGATLCPKCTKTLLFAITNIAAYWLDLETVRTKQTRLTTDTSTPTLGKTQPLVVDTRFLDRTGTGTQADTDTRTTLEAWANTVLEEDPPLAGPAHRDCLHTSCSAVRRRRPPTNTVTSRTRYLLRQERHITTATWAPNILDELTDLEHRLRRLIDRPPVRLYLGACTRTITPGVACDHAVYATEGEDWGTCTADDCDMVYNVAASRHGLETALDEQLYTAAEIASLSTYLSLNASREQVRLAINKWGHRGRITAHAHNQDGHPMYLYGDIRVLLWMRFTPTDDTAETANA